MRTRVRGTAAALAALALTVAGVAATAEARKGVGPSKVWHVADLTVSQHPAGVDWLDGRVVHTATGELQALPWTEAAARSRHLRLLGHTPHGWLVKDFGGDTWNVWLSRGGHREKLSSTSVSEGDLVTVALASTGRRYAVSVFDGDAASTVAVHDLHGLTVASHDFVGDGAVLDLSGSRAVISTTDTSLWWYTDPDHAGTGSVTDLGADGAAASLANDALLVRDSFSGQVGKTTLSSPGTPDWWATIADPRISPDGFLVVGRLSHGSDLVDLHAMTNGSLLKRIEVDHLASEAPTWATSQAYVLVGATHASGDRERLVRCTAAGRCRGQSAVRPRDQISVPPL
jgi:hypothetical protein